MNHATHEVDRDGVRGWRYACGGLQAFNYRTQQWIDTRADAQRDLTAPAGSASNPLDREPWGTK